MKKHVGFLVLLGVLISAAAWGQEEVIEEVEPESPVFPVRPSAGSLDGVYDRLAEDLKAGRPMVTTVYVALCDNDSQGIIPVKNKKICNGNDPANNMYWATKGGLSGWAKRNGWKKVHKETSEDVILETVVWKKKLFFGGELKDRGIKGRHDAYLVGLAYRGKHIDKAMTHYLHAVNHDDPTTLQLKNGKQIPMGPSSHVVGYIGHDYMMDAEGESFERLLNEISGESKIQKGTFALACVGDHFIRPFITRPNVYILLLNKQLTFPGAWTVGGIMDGLAAGKSPKRIHVMAARGFAVGMKAPPNSRIRVFAHGSGK